MWCNLLLGRNRNSRSNRADVIVFNLLALASLANFISSLAISSGQLVPENRRMARYTEQNLEPSQAENCECKRRHNFCLTSANLELLRNISDVIQPIMREELKPGSHVWDLVLAYHHNNNAHHNYFTKENGVAQEIALDFFSSALVSCRLVNQEITSGRVKKAYLGILTWPNYVKSSQEVKTAMELVKNAIFREYDVTGDTEVEEIPGKPYNYQEAVNRTVTCHLRHVVENVTECGVVLDKQVLESELLMKIVNYFVKYPKETTVKAWGKMLPSLFVETELGKWIMEINFHKKLVVEFHNIAKKCGNGEYVLSDEAAKSHDDDKYIPFQILGYTLKWYYKNEGLYLG